MVKVSWSMNLRRDINKLIDASFEFALGRDEDPFEAEERFKSDLKEELTRLTKLISINPFSSPAYNKNNPTRRAFTSDGNFVLEYQIIPYDSKITEDDAEVILTAMLPTRSGEYKGAYGELEIIQFDDLVSDEK